MALQLEKKYKGISANYWKIIISKYNAISKRTTATLALYFSKEARDADIANRLEEKEFQFDGELNIDQLYLKIKESVLGKRVVTPAVFELGEDGAPVFPNVIVTPEVTEDYETNDFVNSLDI